MVTSGVNDQKNHVELVCNKGCLGEFETALQGEMEPIADIMKYVIDNQIPGNLTIHSDAQATRSHIGHIGTGPGQDRAVRVVQTYSSASGKVGVRGLNGFQGIPNLMEVRGPIRLVERQRQRNDKGERL
jgi:hypothetical protein